MEPRLEELDKASRVGRLWAGVLLVALLVLLNAYPHWVGVWVGPAAGWRFLPLLAPAYADHLDTVNSWLILALVLEVLRYRRRRWDRMTRWLEFAVGAVGALTLFHLATGPRVLAPQPEWMDLHGWPRKAQELPQELVASYYVLVKVALFMGFVALVVLSLHRLFRIVGLVEPARKLVREGLGDRGLDGTMALFRREAAGALEVLDRDHAFGREPAGGPARFFHRSKVVLRGIAVQLNPARRLLFVVSMVLAIPDKTRWAAVAGLFFLLLLELVDRVRVRDELDLARELQRDLLPSVAPVLPGWATAHSYRTANAIGGDYHDFLPAADGRVAVVIGDARGHGMAAALVMAIANATLKAAVGHRPEPARVVAQLNRALFRTGGRKAFMTLFYGLLDPGSGRLEYVCAGHPFPLLRRRDGEIVELGAGSLPLGLSERPEIAAESVDLAHDEQVLLYSDGLPEALDGPDGEAFGFRRLGELLADGGSPREIHDRILAAFDDHVGEQRLADDLTLVVLHRLRAASSGQP